MALSFKKAVREQLWIKVLLTGPSGAGKTYSALRIAKGLYDKCGGEGIAYIDTENRRASYYANEFSFDVIDMADPYSPEKYIESIEAAVDAGYKVLIIDSLSLEWSYLNDVHDKMPGNSFTNWAPLKSRHKKLMEKILQSHVHIIATARGKDAYAMEDKNGKSVPKKIAEGIVGDKELEYNYTCTFQLAQDTHVATVMKDNTHIFEGRYDVLTEKDGESIYNWANTGEVPKEEPVEIRPSASMSELEELKSQIGSLAKELVESGNVEKSAIADIVKSKFVVNGKPTANYNAIKEASVARDVLSALESLNK